jgi:hypothetical protein
LGKNASIKEQSEKSLWPLGSSILHQIAPPPVPPELNPETIFSHLPSKFS